MPNNNGTPHQIAQIVLDITQCIEDREEDTTADDIAKIVRGKVEEANLTLEWASIIFLMLVHNDMSDSLMPQSCWALSLLNPAEEHYNAFEDAKDWVYAPIGILKESLDNYLRTRNN